MHQPNDSPRPLERSRRDFLKASAGAVSAATVSSLTIARAAHAAGSDILKVGLIGSGGRGSGAAVQALNADGGAKLVAMADIFEDRLRASRETLKKQKPDQVTVDDEHCFVGFDAYQKVIDSADVVLIACASRFHPQYLKACIDAGKHVFLEKPQAIDPPGVRTLLAASEEAKKKNLSIVAGLHLRYDPANREAMQRVMDGAIGKIVAIEVNFLRNPYRIIERQSEWSEIEWQYRNWYHFRWLSGDDLVQSLVHSADLGAWAMHDEPPVTAHGLGGRSSCFGVQFGDCFDHTSVVYEYSNGVRMYGFDRTQYGCHGDFSTILLGSKGRCELVRRHSIKGETSWRYEGPRADGHAVEQRELFASIRSGTPKNNGLYMARSTMIAILGQMVCYTGKKMTWEQAFNSNFTHEPRECDFSSEPPVTPGQDGMYPVPVPGVTKLT